MVSRYRQGAVSPPTAISSAAGRCLVRLHKQTATCLALRSSSLTCLGALEISFSPTPNIDTMSSKSSCSSDSVSGDSLLEPCLLNDTNQTMKAWKPLGKVLFFVFLPLFLSFFFALEFLSSAPAG